MRQCGSHRVYHRVLGTILLCIKWNFSFKKAIQTSRCTEQPFRVQANLISSSSRLQSWRFRLTTISHNQSQIHYSRVVWLERKYTYHQIIHQKLGREEKEIMPLKILPIFIFIFYFSANIIFYKTVTCLFIVITWVYFFKNPTQNRVQYKRSCIQLLVLL